MTDGSTNEEELEDGTPSNRAGGFSAIEYSGQGDRFWVLPDRGPSDGAASFACRIHAFDLQLDLSSQTLLPKLVSTTMLIDEQERSLMGALASLPSESKRGSALDPEGVRWIPKGGFAISDEYGPAVDLFSETGKRLRSWHLPEWMALTREAKWSPASRGAMPNRGLVGLAMANDGKRLIAAMQGPLIQDRHATDQQPLSPYARLVEIPLANPNATRHWLYPLDSPKNGISEILALPESGYLVIERDGEERQNAQTKAIYAIDLSGAADVSGSPVPPDLLQLGALRPVSKTPFINLLDPRWDIPHRHRLEKPEGMTWGRDLPDGRRSLVICFDNDFEEKVESLFCVFAVKWD